MEEMGDDALDRDARIELSIGTKQQGRADGRYYWPRGLVFDHHRGLLFVVTGNNHRVEAFSCEDGSLVCRFGQFGDLPGRFVHPYGIAIDDDHDRIFITCGNHRVQSWSLSDQSFLSCIGHRGSGDLHFYSSRHCDRQASTSHHHRRFPQRSIGVLVVDRSLVLVLGRQARISAW